MSRFKNMFFIGAITVFIELVVLGYMNKFTFLDSVDVTINKIKEEKAENSKEAIVMPTIVKDFNISFDGSYISYCLGNKIYVINTKSGFKREITLDKNTFVNKYLWLKDRNRLIIGEKKIENSSSEFSLSYYDADKNIKDNITHLSWESKGYNITDISLASSLDIVYTKISNEKKSKIYSVDLVKNLSEIDLKSEILGAMQASESRDELFYEDLKSNKLISNFKGVNKERLDLKDMRFLYFDREENYYFYIEKEGVVHKVIIMKSLNYNSIKQIELKHPVTKKHIYITSKGYIYANEEENKTVLNLLTNKETKYYGRFIGFYDEGFIYEKDKLYKKNFNINVK
ncbi:hypothetical protein ACER0A_008340 [Haloimpatiens sp. FM7315]|uniref:hypothetical protein n=1 Tax=Haloimpatiens sp. FM7315 TaxID=3298609 RepID=UPI00370A5ABF